MSSSPVETILDFSISAFAARAFQSVAELGIADAIGNSPVPVSRLAAKFNVNQDALHRVLRLLASKNVFVVDGANVAHSAASQLLRTDHPHSLHMVPKSFALPGFWNSLPYFNESLATGRAASTNHPEINFWKLLKEDQAAARIFDAHMAGRATEHVMSALSTYDFSKAQRIGDIGGGRGHLIKAILHAVPQATGFIFDQPHVVNGYSVAPDERLHCIGGDFFKDPFPACDLYLLMDIIHDWGDEESIAILNAARKAALPQAKLLIFERVMPDQGDPGYVAAIDIVMLTLFGGKQRTIDEFKSLLAKSGWELSNTFATETGMSLIEAVAV